MSEDLERQLREDRALRSAAWALFDADLAHLRANLAGKSISSRIVDRIGEGASSVLDEAIEVADNNRGVVATLFAAIVLFLARHPLIEMLTGSDEEEAERKDDSAR